MLKTFSKLILMVCITSLVNIMNSVAATDRLQTAEQNFRTNDFENKALAEGRIHDFYESRLSRGDQYAELALSVLDNSSVLGMGANIWMEMQVNALPYEQKAALLHGRMWKDFSHQVNIDLAKAHAKAVNTDTVGIPGLLSAADITKYHEDYFTSLGLPANTFGGSALYFKTDYWCDQCDLLPQY
jgi:hypothetical protein